MNINIPQDKFNSLLLDLLFNLNAELEATRNLVANIYVRDTGSDMKELNVILRELRQAARHEYAAQIKAHFSDFDVDDFLDSLSLQKP